MKSKVTLIFFLFTYLTHAQSNQKSSFDYFKIDIRANNFTFSRKIEDAGYEFINTKNSNFRFLVNKYQYLPNGLEKVADLWIKDLLSRSGGSEKNRKQNKIKINELNGIETISEINLGDQIFYTNIISLKDDKHIYSIATMSDKRDFSDFKKVANTFSTKK